MSAPIPQDCTWVGGVSPADTPVSRDPAIEDVAAGLTTVEAVNERIRALTTEMGLLRLHRTRLRRAERGGALADIKRDFESGMARPAICRKYRLTLGQLTGCANRGGWKCGIRKRGQKPAVSADQLLALRAAYESDPSMLKVIAGRFDITGQTLNRYATRGGWDRLGAASFALAGAEVAHRVPA